MNKSDKEFLKGLALAAAYMASAHGEPLYAKWIIEEHGYTESDLIKAGVEPYDIQAIYPNVDESEGDLE